MYHLMQVRPWKCALSPYHRYIYEVNSMESELVKIDETGTRPSLRLWAGMYISSISPVVPYEASPLTHSITW